MPSVIRSTCFLLLAPLFCSVATAEQPQPAESVGRLNLPGEILTVAERPAFIMLPAAELRSRPQPWIMYAPTLAGYPDQHEKWMHEQFLAAGVAVAGIDAGEAYGSPQGQRLMSALYAELTQKRGFAPRPCLLGRSRGGLWVSSWAIAHPNQVAGIAGIYPVFDLRSYPGLSRAAASYRMTAEQLAANLDQHNPIARTQLLAKAKLPVCIIHGDNDTVVPLKLNSAPLAAQYDKEGAADAMQLIVAEGQGHNFWEGFFRCQPLIDFAIARAQAGAKAADDETSKPPAAEKSKSASPTSDKSKPAKKNPTAAAGTAVTKQTFTYAMAGEKPLLLDLYRPAAATDRLPVVVWVHGGGWKNGNKERCHGAWLAEHGFAIASINYRLTGEAIWPAQIDDCRAAVRWLREHADQHHLNAQRIGAWGASAGGHLAALMGTLDPPADEKVSSRVQAVCDWYGPADLLTMPPNVLGGGRTEQDLANSNGAKLLGGTVRDLPELAKLASPFYQVSKDDPPFLIMHGEKDPGVPLAQSERLHAALRQAGVASILHVVKEAGHGGPGFRTPAAQQLVLDFFEKTLREK